QRRGRLGLSPIKSWLDAIAKLKSPSEMLTLLARMERVGLGGLWGIMLDQDMRSSEQWRMYICQSGLGMPDREYYLKDDAESKRVRAAYERHLEALARLAGYGASEAASRRATIMRIETELARASMRKEDTRDVDKIYNRMSLAQLAKLTPRIDWAEYFRILGAKAHEVIAMQPEFLKAAERMLYTHPIEEWRVYLELQLISDMSGYLTPALAREAFRFYGRALMGTKHMRPLWRRVLGAVSGSLGEPLGRIYIKEHFPPEAKRRMLQMLDDLFEAYEARIKKLDWMSPATKKKALTKLSMVARKIGYPDKWKSYTGLLIKPDDYAGNALRAAAYEHKRAMR
ncbi:MAG: hypothetical protein B7W98_03610, partial [Parcubacteria group bacterium 20-58-5]